MQRQIDCVVSAIGERTQYILVDRGARGVAQRAAGRRGGAAQELDLPVDLLFGEGDGSAHFGTVPNPVAPGRIDGGSIDSIRGRGRLASSSETAPDSLPLRSYAFTIT